MPTDAADPAGLRRPLLRLAAVAVASLAAILILEVLVRALGLVGDSFYVPDRRTGWVHRPGARGRYVSDRARAPVVINALGLMGPETTAMKPAGKHRLLLLGDSFTESMQVPWPESWANVVRRNLGPDWEVLNAGVAGYGTDNALLYYENRGRVFDPDVVLLLFFTGNDVSDNDHALSREIGGVEPKPYYEIDADSLRIRNFPLPPPPSGVVPGVKRFLSEHSRLYLLIRTRRNQLAGRNRGGRAASAEVPLAWQVYRREPSAEWDRAWRVTAGLLAELGKKCSERRARFLVAGLPTGWRVEPEQRRELLARYPALEDEKQWDIDLPDHRLNEILEKENLPYVSLTDTLLAARNRADVALYSDHLSGAGHEIVGAAIAQFLFGEVGEIATPRKLQH